MTEPVVFKWAWRHGSLEVEEFSTLDEAVRAAVGASAVEVEAVDCIEEIRADGSRIVHDNKATHELMAPIEREQEQQYEEMRRARPEPTVILDLVPPDGRSFAAHESYVELEDAEREARRFRELLGADRVRLRKYGTLTQEIGSL